MIRGFKRAGGVVLLVGGLLLARTCGAEAPPELPTFGVSSLTQLAADEAADLTQSVSAIGFQTATVTAEKGSDLLVRYASPKPLRIAYFPHAPMVQSMRLGSVRAAILPATASGQIMLSLLSSISWEHTYQEVTVFVIADAADPPTIASLSTVDRSTALGRLWRDLTLVFAPEHFTITTINYLLGYEVFGMPFSLVLAGFGCACFAALVAWRRSRIFTWLIVSCLLAIALYQLRFAADDVSATLADGREWFSHGTFGQMGGIYAAAEYLRVLREEDPSMVVAMCGPMVTPLKYALFPIPTVDASQWSKANYAVLFDHWTQSDGVIACGSVTQAGKILGEFPDGTAVMKFAPLHP